jgi:hypothetical protein
LDKALSEALYTRVFNVEDDQGKPWIKAEIILEGEVVSTGIAPERPPYVEGTARSSAVSRAQIDFHIHVLGKDIRNDPDFVEKEVKGAS